MAKPSLEPLRFERRFFDNIWGGRRLAERPGLELPDGMERVGETWEVVDRETENSVVAAGAFQGRTLGELVHEHGRELLGKAPATSAGRFPLLVKYIDAAQNLSVQVHPDDERAARIDGAEAKTEAWYVVDAAPGAVIYAGLKPEVEEESFAAIAAGPEVVDALMRWDVRRGDCLLVPGGTVHAIGAGVTILEVQQNSDTTYRLYDWGRVDSATGEPRATHVPQALQCIRFGAPERPPLTPEYFDEGEGRLVAPLARTQHFAMNALRVSGSARMSAVGQFQIYALIEGAGRLTVSGRDGEWELSQGDVWLVPAVCGYHHLESRSDEMQLVQMLYRA